ncbi:DNA methyltransferase [Sulfolobus sp. E11-6]|uniref:DNA methyltransferase n=1 Tax=Sulfolobus sp. E11-6 TaxID=2663020 RepID=UPI001294BE13|nr:DNA methyltransferase [Sulfolobus sp. E11-6]QGA69060.1 DNA methyltransferase [Sulfolobus sp. E11-6]
MLMRYWGRKPSKLINEVMSGISGTVIDPFGGAGSIALVSLNLGNKAIYLDINPYAWLVAFVNIVSIDAKEFKEKSDEVLENLSFVRKRKLRNDYLYYANGKPFWKKRNAERISDFFSKNNFTKLYSILKTIDKIEASPEVKIALYAAFCDSLFKSSKMKRKGAGSWGVPSYWIPREHNEINAIEAFRTSITRFYSYFKTNKGYKLGEDVKLLFRNALTFQYDKDVILFTDPPFFDEVQYTELSFFYWAWLRESEFTDVVERFTGQRLYFNSRDEIIVNPNRGKGYETYLKKLEKFFSKTRRVRSKYLLFHYDNESLKQKVIILAKEKWKDISVNEFELGNQRNIGPKGSKKYILIYSSRE